MQQIVTFAEKHKNVCQIFKTIEKLETIAIILVDVKAQPIVFAI